MKKIVFRFAISAVAYLIAIALACFFLFDVNISWLNAGIIFISFSAGYAIICLCADFLGDIAIDPYNYTENFWGNFECWGDSFFVLPGVIFCLLAIIVFLVIAILVILVFGSIDSFKRKFGIYTKGMENTQ